MALNKTDLADGAEMAEMIRGELESRGHRVFDISALNREGLRALGFAMAELVEEARAQREVELAPVPVTVRPKAVNQKEFTISQEEQNGEPLWRVRGAKPERWILQTDFNNDEAVGYLADRLAKIGIEDELFKQGARPGDSVLIGSDEDGVVFEWEPTMAARRASGRTPRHRPALRGQPPPHPRAEASGAAGPAGRQGRYTC